MMSGLSSMVSSLGSKAAPGSESPGAATIEGQVRSGRGRALALRLDLPDQLGDVGHVHVDDLAGTGRVLGDGLARGRIDRAGVPALGVEPERGPQVGDRAGADVLVHEVLAGAGLQELDVLEPVAATLGSGDVRGPDRDR